MRESWASSGTPCRRCRVVGGSRWSGGSCVSASSLKRSGQASAAAVATDRRSGGMSEWVLRISTPTCPSIEPKLTPFDDHAQRSNPPIFGPPTVRSVPSRSAPVTGHACYQPVPQTLAPCSEPVKVAASRSPTARPSTQPGQNPTTAQQASKGRPRPTPNHKLTQTLSELTGRAGRHPRRYRPGRRAHPPRLDQLDTETATPTRLGWPRALGTRSASKQRLTRAPRFAALMWRRALPVSRCARRQGRSTRSRKARGASTGGSGSAREMRSLSPETR